MIRYESICRSNGRLDRVPNLLEVLLAWVHFLADCYESLDALHPFTRVFLVEDVGHLGGISSDCDAQHGNSEGPGRIADGEVDVFIVGLYVLADETAVHDVVDGSDHIFIPSSLLHHH